MWLVFGVAVAVIQWLLGWLFAGFSTEVFTWRTPIEDGELLILALGLAIRAVADFSFCLNLNAWLKAIGLLVCVAIIVIVAAGYALVTNSTSPSDAEFTVRVSLRFYLLAVIVSGAGTAVAER